MYALHGNRKKYDHVIDTGEKLRAFIYSDVVGICSASYAITDLIKSK